MMKPRYRQNQPAAKKPTKTKRKNPTNKDVTESQKEVTVQNEKSQNDQMESKDRAQSGATSTLAITQVSLLKSILDGGPGQYTYYTTALVLVCLTLALTTMAGLLMVLMYILKSRLTKQTKSLSSSSVKGWHLDESGEHADDEDDTKKKKPKKKRKDGLGAKHRVCKEIQLKCEMDLVQSEERLKMAHESKTTKSSHSTSPPENSAEIYELVDVLMKKSAMGAIDGRSKQGKNLNSIGNRKSNGPGNGRSWDMHDDVMQKALTIQRRWQEANLETAKRREAVLQKAAYTIRHQTVMKHVSLVQQILTCIFSALAILNVFLAVFAVRDITTKVDDI